MPKKNNRLRRARIACKLTQKQLAAKVGSVNVEVSRWEKGHYKPCVDKCRQIAKALGATVEELFG